MIEEHINERKYKGKEDFIAKAGKNIIKGDSAMPIEVDMRITTESESEIPCSISVRCTHDFTAYVTAIPAEEMHDE